MPAASWKRESAQTLSCEHDLIQAECWYVILPRRRLPRVAATFCTLPHSWLLLWKVRSDRTFLVAFPPGWMNSSANFCGRLAWGVIEIVGGIHIGRSSVSSAAPADPSTHRCSLVWWDSLSRMCVTCYR